MDFLGINIDTLEGSAEASRCHRKLVRSYMKMLDRYRTLPACEDLTYNDLLAKGYPKDFLDAQETFTCLPPPGDPLYQKEDSPFEMQYNELLDRMDRDQEECQKEDQEFFDSLNEEEQTIAQAMSLATAMVNTFFMLSLDCAQVCVIGNMPFCTPHVQLEILGFLGQAAAYCRNAFDRMHLRQRACAAEMIWHAGHYGDLVRQRLNQGIATYPRFKAALETRVQLLNQALGNLQNLLDYLTGKTKGLGQ